MKTPNDETHFPLHVTISALFIGLIVVFSVVLSWQNYSRTSEIMLASADQVNEQVAREMALDFKGTYHPVADTLKLLALSPMTGAHSLEERLGSLRMFVIALMDAPSVSAIQIGYADGDFFIIRPLSTADLRRTFAAPDTAQYVIDHVDTYAGGTRRLTRMFLDKALHEIHRNVPIATDFDPRTRPWYLHAGERPTATAPYLFYFMAKAGTTVTLKTDIPGVVVATDITLDRLSETISRHRITPSSEVVLVDADGRVLAYHDSGKLVRGTDARGFRMARLSELGSPVLEDLSKHLAIEPQRLDFSSAGRHWKGTVNRTARAGNLDLYILMISPLDELLSEAIAIRWLSVLITIIIVLIAIPIVWYVATRISNPLRRLATEADLISHFDFSSPVETRSTIKEIDTLANAMSMMKKTINRFLVLINSLAGEKELDSLLESITRETMQVSQADGVLTYLVDDSGTCLEPVTLYAAEKGDCSVERLPRLSMIDDRELVDALGKKEPILIQLDSRHSHALQPLLALIDAESLALISVPLHNRQNEVVGVLCLLFQGQDNDLHDERHREQISFLQALSGFAAVTLESRHLLMMQEALLDSFIKLIAGAIDTKSPYTGGHCERVPELMKMLAQAACDSSDSPFRDFQLQEDEWDAVNIASWLHDCGKVTTPEYVVDKATKLETIYDRIHEIRMRFEVLKRDAEIRYREAVAEGGERDTLRNILEDEWRQLDDEFAFIAACNEGGEFMAPEKTERLRRIAERTWARTLDDRIGISWEEKQRKERTPASPLPVQEKLLDDKTEHLIEREESERIPADNPWGFKLDVPEYKFNRGEIYNLSISRGTLSTEERFKINDHMIQTIIMLDKLPYPKHLRDVPIIAGCHHETMDGKGYPKRLSRDQMPLTARMMAIADIFEALTASDRPYKKAKTLSEAIRILSFMRNDRHIDPDLFDLFLTSGIWLEYAHRFLQPEQIDEVDISQYLEACRT